jgi:large subunit ribosomal protein L13
MTRDTYTIDAAGKALGRLATDVAIHLRGKHKPEYVPHIDGGDIVVVENVAKMKLTGKKMEQKVYHSYSGYPGGLKTKQIKDIFAKNAGEVLTRAVREMLPPIRFRGAMMKRLIIR